MTILEDFLETLQSAEMRREAVLIPAHLVQQVHADLKQALERVYAHQELVELQRIALMRANRMYKRANKWPSYQFPDLAVLIDWLLDHNNRRMVVKMQTALETIYTRLDGLGEVSMDDIALVPGRIIISIRALSSNILQESDELNHKYSHDQLPAFLAHDEGTASESIYGGGDVPV